MRFAKLALQSMPEVALDRRRADAFPPPQTAAVDPVQMLEKDRLLKRFAGTLARQDAWESLPEMAPTVLAPPLSRLQFQYGVAHAEVLVPHLAGIPALAAQPLPLAVRAGDRPLQEQMPVE